MFYRECQVLRSRFAYPVLFLCLSLLLTACGHSTASFLAKGEEYLQKRKFHDALMQFQSAVETDDGSALAHWGLARAYENLGQFSETLEELRKTVEIDSSNLDAQAKLGNYFLLVKPPLIAETEKIRNEILEADPMFIEGHILSAAILAAQGKPDAEVVAAVQKAIDLNPKRIESYISLERLYMTREQPVAAEAAIQKGIAECPAAIGGYTEYGRFLMYANRDIEAEAQFSKAISIDELSIEARESTAEFYVTSRQIDKAEKAYSDLVLIQENSPESRLVLAEFYAKVDRKDDAIAALNEILMDAPTYVLARYRLGNLYLERKEVELVNEQLGELFKINDDDIEALMLRARLRIYENHGEDAIKDLEEVLKKIPSGREPLFLMSQARLSLGQVDQANAFIADLERYHPNYLKTGLLKIQSAFTAGDSQKAFKLSNELIDRANAATPNADSDPQSIQDLRVRGISSRGLANLDLGKTAEAKADLQEIVRVSPKSSSAMVNLAKVLTAEKDFEGAAEMYAKAFAADIQNFDAVTGIIYSHIRLKQTPKAHAAIDTLIVNNANNRKSAAAYHYLKSTIFTSERKGAEAERELLAAIDIDENYLPAYSAYASHLVEQDRKDDAVAQYKKLLAKRASAPIYTLLGILEDSRGNTAAAESAYRRALDIAPETLIAANNLAWLIADNNGNLDEALQLASMTVSRNQSVAGYYDTLGWVYLKKGLASPAVEQLKKAVALDNTNTQKLGTSPNPGYRVRLGMALAKAGDKVSARREVETSLQRVDVLSQREIRDAKSILANL